MKTNIRLAAIAAGILLSVGAPRAQAQDRKVGLYVGYAFLKTDDVNLHGARISPEFRVNDFASVVADLSWEKGTVSSSNSTITTYLGGLRLSRSVGSVRVFVHALAGGVRSSASVNPFEGVTISVSDTGLGLDGGGGVEFGIGVALKMRLGADYLRRKVDLGGFEVSQNDVRATLGVVF